MGTRLNPCPSSMAATHLSKNNTPPRETVTRGETHPDFYREVVGVEGMFFEARAVANSTVVAGALMSVSGRLLP
jgi:hypothetical protein